MNINNVNYSNYASQNIANQKNIPLDGKSREEITAIRKMALEVNRRADPGGRLMDAHMMKITFMRNQGTGQSVSINTFTPAMESFQTNRLSIIQELMAEQEEGSFKLNALKEMLERTQQILEQGRLTGNIGGGHISTFNRTV